MKQYIGSITVLVRDYDEALAYYTQVLGFRLVEDTPLGDGKRWVLVAPPGAVESRLLLAKARKPEEVAAIGHQAGGRVLLFLHTDDFARDHTAFLSRGVRFAEKPREEPYGTVAVFTDLYGNRWDLLQLKVRGGALERTPEASTGAVTIRPIRETDVAGFRDTLSAVCRERKYLAWIEAPPLEKTRAFVGHNVRNGWPQFVAVDGDRIVGWCDAIPGDASTGTAHIGRLGMGVLQEYRGRGLGTRLLAATVARARELRLGKIELSVYASNAPAIALYRKCGFVDEGCRRRGRLVGGVYDDVVLMALDLAPRAARGQPDTDVTGV